LTGKHTCCPNPTKRLLISRQQSLQQKFHTYRYTLNSISNTAALRCALRAIVNDSERYVAMSRYICSAISLHRSLSLTTRSAALVETGLYTNVSLNHLSTRIKESHAVARKPRDAAAILFGQKFADNIHYKFKSSQASKGRLQSSNIPAQNRI